MLPVVHPYLAAFFTLAVAYRNLPPSRESGTRDRRVRDPNRGLS